MTSHVPSASGGASTRAGPSRRSRFAQPWSVPGAERARGRRYKVIYYQYRADRGRTLQGIDEQVAEAEKVLADKAPIKRNGFIALDSGTSVNREPEASRATPPTSPPARTAPVSPRVRDQPMPPTVANRGKLPHGQERPASPARLI
jgi:hypothetical protein